MNKKRKGGRPKIKTSEKVKVVSAYLKEREQKAVVSQYGSITNAIREEVLPKCEVA